MPFCSLFVPKYPPECEFSCRNLITCSALVFSKINHCSQSGKKACIDGVYLRTFWAKQLNDKEVKSATLPRFSLLRVLARDERPDTVADNELSPMHLAAAQVPFSGTRCPQVLLLKCVSTARGGKLVPGSSCVAESPAPSPTIPGHRVALQLRLHSTYADWLRSWDCQSRNQKELLGEGLVSTEEL